MFFLFTLRYFDDPSVLDRVPGMFLLLGGIFLIMGYTGTILMREPTKKESRQLLRWAEDNKDEATKVGTNAHLAENTRIS